MSVTAGDLARRRGQSSHLTGSRRQGAVQRHRRSYKRAPIPTGTAVGQAAPRGRRWKTRCGNRPPRLVARLPRQCRLRKTREAEPAISNSAGDEEDASALRRSVGRSTSRATSTHAGCAHGGGSGRRRASIMYCAYWRCHASPAEDRLQCPGTRGLVQGQTGCV